MRRQTRDPVQRPTAARVRDQSHIREGLHEFRFVGGQYDVAGKGNVRSGPGCYATKIADRVAERLDGKHAPIQTRHHELS